MLFPTGVKSRREGEKKEEEEEEEEGRRRNNVRGLVLRTHFVGRKDRPSSFMSLILQNMALLLCFCKREANSLRTGVVLVMVILGHPLVVLSSSLQLILSRCFL